MSDDNNTNEIEELKQAIEVLSTKNRELLGELKTAKAKAKGVEIDPAEHAALQTEVESLKAQLDKQSKDSQKEIEKLTNTLAQKDGALQTYLIDNGLSDALIKAGVRPEMMSAVKAMLKSQAVVKAEGDSYKALMGDKALADAVAEWAATDEGKHFVAAQNNNGSGAAGGNGTGGGAAKGDFGGDKSKRTEAIKGMFPELAQT